MPQPCRQPAQPALRMGECSVRLGGRPPGRLGWDCKSSCLGNTGSARGETEQPQSWERRQEPRLPAAAGRNPQPPQGQQGDPANLVPPLVSFVFIWKRTLLPQGRGTPGLGPRALGRVGREEARWGAALPPCPRGGRGRAVGCPTPSPGGQWGLGCAAPAREASAAPQRYREAGRAPGLGARGLC